MSAGWMDDGDVWLGGGGGWSVSGGNEIEKGF